MRTATVAQLERQASPHFWLALRADIQDVDGNWVRLDTLGGLDWVKGADWGANVDQPVQNGSLRLLRERGTTGVASLAPLIEASGYNRDAAGNYAPLLNAGRRLRLFTSMVDPGGDFATEWMEVLQAKVDRVKWPSHLAVLEFRDLGAFLQDTQIQAAKVYGSEEGTAVEAVMQEILDDNETGVTLHTPASPGWFIHEYEQAADTNVLDALLKLSRQIGHEVRYMYDAAGQFRLTFYKPDREPVATHHTFGSDDYLDVTNMDLSDTNVRTQVRLFAEDQDGNLLEAYRESVAAVAEFGPRYMEVTEDKTSNIDTQGELDALGDIILSDLANPNANQETRNLYFPWIQVGDFYRWEPNGYHYDVAQELAVMGYRHQLENGTGYTNIQVRGKPAGAYHAWIRGFGGSTRSVVVAAKDVSLVWDEEDQALRLSGMGEGSVQSAIFMVDDSPGFDTPIIQEHLAFTNGQLVVRDYGLALFTRGETYYGRVVPYRGPLDGGMVTGLPGQSALDMAVIPAENLPHGSISSTVDEDGHLSFVFSGSPLAESFSYVVNKVGFAADSTGATVVDASAGEVVIDPGVLALAIGERAYITGWFYREAAGNGTEGPPVYGSGTRTPVDDEGTTEIITRELALAVADEFLQTVQGSLQNMLNAVGLSGTGFYWEDNLRSLLAGPTNEKISAMPVYDINGIKKLIDTEFERMFNLSIDDTVEDLLGRSLNTFFGKSSSASPDDARAMAYTTGATVDSLRPNQSGADKTGDNVAWDVLTGAGKAVKETGAEPTTGKSLTVLTDRVLDNIADGSTWKRVVGVTGNRITDSSVVDNMFANSAVVTRLFASGVFTQGVFSDLVVASAILGNKIASLQILTEHLVAGAATFGKIDVAFLSLISGDVGVLNAGRLQNAAGTHGILLSGSLPAGWSRWLNYADASKDFLRHDALVLRWDGSADYSGPVSASLFTSPMAKFHTEVQVGYSDANFVLTLRSNQVRFEDGNGLTAWLIHRNNMLEVDAMGNELFLGGAIVSFFNHAGATSTRMKLREWDTGGSFEWIELEVNGVVRYLHTQTAKP